MSLHRLTTLGMSALALLAMSALARADYIKLKNGDRIEGQATAYDDTTEILSFRTKSGEMREIHVNEMKGRSYYQVIRSKVPKDSGTGQLQLANFARDVGLYAHSVRHYEYAAKADPSLQRQIDADVAVLRREAGAWAMGLAKDALKKDDWKTAEKWLTKIVRKLPEEAVAREAEALLDQRYTAAHAAKDDELERKHAERLKKDLKKAKKYYDDMLEENRKGLTNTSSGNKSVSAWERAVKDGRNALKELDRFQKKNDERDLVEALDGYRKLINEHLIDIHLNLASHWSTRSSYNKAQGEVNQALAIDPKNREARSMRARIEEASSRGLDWGWGWGGRRSAPRTRDS